MSKLTNKCLVTTDKLTAIGDATREVLKTTDTYTLDEMPEVIKSLSGSAMSIIQEDNAITLINTPTICVGTSLYIPTNN